MASDIDYSVEDNGLLIENSLRRCRERLEVDAELARSRPDPTSFMRVREGVSSIECAERACELYAERPCLVEWETRSGEPPVPRVLRYREVWSKVQTVAASLGRFLSVGERVGICGAGSIGWVIADLSLLYGGATSVPLQASLNDEALSAILLETGMRCIFCSAAELPRLARLLTATSPIHTIVLLDDPIGGRVERTSESLRAAVPRRILLLSMAELEQGTPGPHAPASTSPDEIRTIVYTSGTTGIPKGALFPERLWVRHWRGGIFSQTLSDIPQINVSFMPLNHAMGRAQIIASIVRGGVTYFTRTSDMSTLFEDIRLARPTLLALVPRVAELLRAEFENRILTQCAGASSTERARVERSAIEAMRSHFLGDRLFAISHGSAPTAESTLAFLKRCFGVPVFSGYGTTEAGLITFDSRVVRDSVADYKLVDRPDLGYSRSDLPYPRGELRVKTHYAIPGYLAGTTVESSTLFDADGFMRTGDIVEKRGDEVLVWLDRVGDVLKLAQGEFVSASRLESIYAGDGRLIEQIYIHGEGSRSFVLAVVVPDTNAIAARLAGKVEPSTDELVRSLILGEIRAIAKRRGLRGYEVPRDVLIEHAAFTNQNGLLTETHKPSRPRLRARFEERLRLLYLQLEARQKSRFDVLASEVGLSPDQRAEELLAASLGVDVPYLRDVGGRFTELGGDSLTAVHLTTLIRDRCGVEVSLEVVLGAPDCRMALLLEIERAGHGNISHSN